MAEQEAYAHRAMTVQPVFGHALLIAREGDDIVLIVSRQEAREIADMLNKELERGH